MKKYISVIVIIFLSFLLTGCDLFKQNPKVVFNYNCEGLNDYKCQVIDNKLNCMFIMPECGEKTFVGWYDAKTSGKEVNLDADFTKDTIIYANWKEDGEVITPEPVEPEPSKPEVKPTPEPTTPEVEEEIIKYKVTFNANGGTGGQTGTIEVKYGELMPSISKTVPIKDGYTFMGWYDNSDYTKGEAYYNEKNDPAKYYDRTSNLSLYAGWKEKPSTPVVPVTPTVEKYKISFNVNGGSGGQKGSLDVIYNDVMPTITASKPTRKGYTFMGWFNNSNYTKGIAYYNNNQESTLKFDKKSNITLYAGWKINTYKITFNLNGGIGGQNSDAIVEYDAMMPTINRTIPIKEGYTFTGWYDNADYTKGKVYYNEKCEATKYYDKTSNITLYAGWSKIIVVQKYKVTFNINGGSGTTPSAVDASVGNNMPPITTIVPTRVGYIFMGWYNNSNYTKGTQYYTNTNQSARKYDIKNNVTLYAGWKANVLTIQYNGNGGVWDNSSNGTYSVNSSGTVILKSNNSIYGSKYNYGSSLSNDGLVDYNGTFNWTNTGSFVPLDKEYIISNGTSNTEVSQSKVYTAVDIAKFGGCDLSKNNCTVMAKVNWKKGQIIRAASFNIGYFGCGTSTKVSCKSSVDKITELFKNNNLDIVGIQEGVPAGKVIQVGKNTGMKYYYQTQPANVNVILSRFDIKSKKTTTLVSCHEKRSLDKTIVNINGVDISFYNTHFSYQSGCPAKHMQDVAKIIKSDPNPIILVGDTNTTPITNYETYLKPLGFEVAAHNTAASGVEGKNSWCDSVFIKSNGHIGIIDSTTINTYGKLSDHNLVYATLAIY